MGRPRSFDETDAIARAMLVFWDKGYEAAALPDLLKGMGLSRGSFYKAFGDKRSVYLAALNHYEQTVLAPIIAGLLEQGGVTGFQRIGRLFRLLARPMTKSEARRGCFVCKAAVDRAPHDAVVEKSVNAVIARLEKAFYVALMDRKEGARAVLPRRAMDAARQLTACYLGIQVLRNAGANPDSIRSIADQTLAGLAGSFD